MLFKSSKQKTLSIIVLGIYLFLLFILIFFKLKTKYQPNNIIETTYNILIIIPLGLFISIFKNNWSLIKKILFILGFSLIFEALQYLVVIKTTNIINNIIGGLFGILAYLPASEILKNNFITIINIIALTMEIIALLIILFIPIFNCLK